MNNPWKVPQTPTATRAHRIEKEFEAKQPQLWLILKALITKCASRDEQEINLAIIAGLEAFTAEASSHPLRVKISMEDIKTASEIFAMPNNLEWFERNLSARMRFRFKGKTPPRHDEHATKRAALLGEQTHSDAWRLAYVLSLYVTEVEAISLAKN